MKNMEWGAMAYLTNSIYGRYTSSSTCIESGCEVWINNINTGTATDIGVRWGPTITGCSGAVVSANMVNYATSCETNRTWNTNGINASTNGNVTGIYDVSGGTWKYTMGNMENIGGTYNVGGSELNNPGSKYYDAYNNSASNYLDHNRGLIGDATKEILMILGVEHGGWNGDRSVLPYDSSTWIVRSGYAGHNTTSGIFNFSCFTGESYTFVSFRITLSAS